MKYGQHFLTDQNIICKEIKYADINKNDTVLEIGPGKGSLTKILAEKAKKVIAVEIDNKLIKQLKKELPINVILIHDDAVKTDFNKLPKFNKIVSNLPFEISSPITFKLINHGFDIAILIYQEEFAQRMVAGPSSKNYSRLSIAIHYKTKCELLDFISKNYFKPPPEIDARIIRLKPRKKPPFYVNNEQFFFNIVKLFFNHRRKKIKTILKQNFSDTVFNDICNIDKRVDNLTSEQIGLISNELYNRINKKNK